MKTAIASAMALLLLTSTASAMTVGEFVRIAKNNTGFADTIFSTYDGASEMHKYLQLRADLRDAPYVYCVKQEINVTPVMVTGWVSDYLDAEPNEKENDFARLSSVVIQTLKWKFPCD